MQKSQRKIFYGWRNPNRTARDEASRDGYLAAAYDSSGKKVDAAHQAAEATLSSLSRAGRA